MTRIVLDRYLDHRCPAIGDTYLPPSSPPDALFRRWQCEFCGFDMVEK